MNNTTLNMSNTKKIIYWGIYIIYLLILVGILFFAYRYLTERSPTLTDMAKKDFKNIKGSVFTKLDDNKLIYALNPNTSKEHKDILYCINSDGFRDRDFSINKPQDTIRIVMLGDSFTFGDGLPIEHTIAKQLECILNENNKNNQYEVMNFGISGYNTMSEVIFFEQKALKYKPDIVFIMYFLNDPDKTTINFSLGNYGLEVCLFLKDYFSGKIIDKKLILQVKNFLGSKLVEKKLKAIHDNNSDLNTYYHFIHNIPFYWDDVKDSFKKLRKLCDKNNIKTTIAVIPELNVSSLSEYDYADIHSLVLNEASTNGFNTIDILPFFENLDINSLKLSKFDHHTSAFGNRIIAYSIASLILKTKLMTDKNEFKTWKQSVINKQIHINSLFNFDIKDVLLELKSHLLQNEKLNVIFAMDCKHIDGTVRFGIKGKRSYIMYHDYLPPRMLSCKVFNPLQRENKEYKLIKIKGRENAKIIEMPSQYNDYTLFFEIQDISPGDDHYRLYIVTNE